jgi:rhodanese-related sulfurtransferase
MASENFNTQFELDAKTIEAIRSQGANMSLETDVTYYLYIPNLRDAREAALSLKAAGYQPVVEEPLGDLGDGTVESRYGVVASIMEVPSLENVRKARRRFEELARKYHGEYDGWEAEVKK